MISSFSSIRIFSGAKMEKKSVTFQQLKITLLKSGVVKKNWIFLNSANFH